MLGYVAFREHQIVALDAADVDLALVEGLFALRAALLADDDRRTSVGSLARLARSPRVARLTLLAMKAEAESDHGRKDATQSA